MRQDLALAFVIGLPAAGCSTVEARREQSAQVVGALLRERTGFEVAPAPPQDGAIDPRARELLTRPLTEEAAVKIALVNNRSVAAAFARLGVESAELVQAGLLANPVFDLNAKFFGSGTEIEAGIVESFFDVFFVSARRRVAESEFEAAKLHIVEELVRLTHDVKRAFIDVRAARRLVEVEHEVLRAAQASVDLMTQLHRAGNVIDPELTAEELALARAKLAVAQVEAAMLEAREPLNALLGLWGDAVSWTIDGTLTDDAASGLDFEHVEMRAIGSSLGLAEIRARATAQVRRLGFVGWEAVLDPGALGVLAKQESDVSGAGLGPAVGFSLPIFDGGGTRRAAAAAKLEESLAQHISTAVDVRSAARRLRERTLALSEQVLFIREEELPKAKRLVRETLRNYNAMQIGVFEVFVARQQEIEAARNYVETLRAAWIARVDLEELLAGSMNEARIHLSPSSSAKHASMKGQR